MTPQFHKVHNGEHIKAGEVEWEQWRLLVDPRIGAADLPCSSRPLPQGATSFATGFRFSEEQSFLLTTSADAQYIRRTLRLSKYTAKDVFDVLSENSPAGMLTKEGFVRACLNLASLHGVSKGSRTFDAAHHLVEVVFDALVAAFGNAPLSFTQIASGLGSFCVGKLDERMATIFENVGSQGSRGDHLLTLVDFAEYLSSIFAITAGIRLHRKMIEHELQYTDAEETLTLPPSEVCDMGWATARLCYSEAGLPTTAMITVEQAIQFLKNATTVYR